MVDGLWGLYREFTPLIPINARFGMPRSLVIGVWVVVELGGIEPPTSTLPVPKLLVTRLHNES